MDATVIIISLCVLVLLAYVFDFTSSRTRIPTVILLVLTGWLVQQAVRFTGITMPALQVLLPVLGTVGLILIVLEGALELELNRSKLRTVRRSFTMALLPMVVLSLGMGYWLYYMGQGSFRICLLNSIPFSVVSSAIAIPSARNLGAVNREFVVYESSLSDILGVLFFNFIALNEVYGVSVFAGFGFEIIIMLVVSFAVTIGLSLLLNRIEHHVKFIPLILLVILLYALSKVFHLPGLIFILLFGLFLGNIGNLRQVGPIHLLKPDELIGEVTHLKELTVEAAFLIRTLFFLLFGYLLQTEEILNADSFPLALVIVGGILLFRYLQLKLYGMPAVPLVFIAPRGLITVLLFLAVEPKDRIPLVNNSLAIQVIVLSALVMMMGTMQAGKKRDVPGDIGLPVTGK